MYIVKRVQVGVALSQCFYVVFFTYFTPVNMGGVKGLGERKRIEKREYYLCCRVRIMRGQAGSGIITIPPVKKMKPD